MLMKKIALRMMAIKKISALILSNEVRWVFFVCDFAGMFICKRDIMSDDERSQIADGVVFRVFQRISIQSVRMKKIDLSDVHTATMRVIETESEKECTHQSMNKAK